MSLVRPLRRSSLVRLSLDHYLGTRLLGRPPLSERPAYRDLDRRPVDRDLDRRPVDRDLDRRPVDRDLDRRPISGGLRRRAPSRHPRSLLRRLTAPLLLALSLPLLLLTAAPAAAADAAGAVPTGLTPRQEGIVLDLVDDICGDTWCEGDHAFEFRRFSCDPARATCTLAVRIAPRVDGPLHWRWRAGTVRGFSRFWQMVDTGPTGYRSLDPAFYDAVSTLVGRLEATVPPPAPGVPG